MNDSEARENVNTTPMITVEYAYLLCVYLIVSDSEIHSKELDFLRSHFTAISEECKREASKIMSDSEDKLALDVIIDYLQEEAEQYQMELMEVLLQLSIADSFFHKKESAFVSNIARELKLPANDVNALIEKYDEPITVQYTAKKQSFYGNLKENVSKALHDLLGNDYFEQNLLEGNTFVDKIKEIAGRASNDLDLASKKMEQLNIVLEDNFTVIESASERIKKVESKHKKESLLQCIDKLNNETKQAILSSIKNNKEILDKKKYTIDYFSIAFLGRTKAGKSTFHKVITGEETDDVGVGKLRTTRYNRVFNWENIRIIDTPGIGAPGGKDDTEIARSIIDEADLICYVVSNDSIQETEFNFLTELKNKNKTVFIILNYKENLEHSVRMERFVKNPKAWLENTSDRSINGHIQRITEMVARSEYDASLIEIVPIHLLAAKLAKEEQHFNRKKTLAESSNMSAYYKLIKQTIYRNGNLKKTQNIIDGCNYQTNSIYIKTKGELDGLNKLLKEIMSEKKRLLHYFDDTQKKTTAFISASIKNTHNAMRVDLKMFAASEYENKDIGKAWEKSMTNKGYYPALQLNIENSLADFQKKIESRVKESVQDIAINMANIDLPTLSINVTDYKLYANIGMGAATATLGIFALTNFWNPAGWVIGAITAVGIGVSFLANYAFDSKKEKIEKAAKKIEETIQPMITANEKEIKKSSIDAFSEAAETTRKKLATDFDELIDGIKNIITVLSQINSSSKEHSDYFNKIIFFRSLEHLKKIKLGKALTEQDILRYLSHTSINREGENLNVTSSYKLTKEELMRLNKVLQLKITLN